jgi:uncharacterized protein
VLSGACPASAIHVSRSLRNCLAHSRGLGCGDVRVPTDKAILALHEQHAPTPEALEAVYTHCVIVCGIAEQLHARSGREASLDLVRAGCLLHDVGVYRLHDGAGRLDHANYIRHGVLGHELLAAEGFSEVICRFASHHTGGGLVRTRSSHVTPRSLTGHDH